jgi:hypothetical protein
VGELAGVRLCFEGQEPEVGRWIAGAFKEDNLVAYHLAMLFGESYFAAVVAKFGNGDQRVGCEAWEDVALGGLRRQGGEVKVAGVAGSDPGAVGHSDGDGVVVAVWIEVGAVGHDIVSSGSSVSDGIIG